MELNLKILAPLLQYTSIDRCVLFMRNKKIYIILFSSLALSYHRASLSHSLSSPSINSGLSTPSWSSSSTLPPQLRSEAHRQRHRPKPRSMPSPIHASADQTHFSSADQTHADTVLPKSQATIAAHLSILFAVIDFFFFFNVFSYGFGGCGGGVWFWLW